MQPLVSFILLTYNQSRTIEEALDSLLAQTYSPLEIVISDDHSADDTWQRIQQRVAAYQGPHRIKLSQNPENLGVNGNYNQAFALASGELILIAAGDDISLPERAAVTVAHWLRSDRKPRLIATPVIDLDTDGTPVGRIEVSDLEQIHSLADWLAKRPFVIGAGHAWHRSLFHDFALLPTLLNHEDQIASYRAALLNAGVTLNTPLVMYRRGGSTSQMQPDSLQQWLAKRHLDATRDAAFWQQLLTDSATFSVDTKSRHQVRRRLARCSFEVQMLEARGLANQLRALTRVPETDLAFRLRTFFNVRFAAAIFNRRKRSL